MPSYTVQIDKITVQSVSDPTGNNDEVFLLCQSDAAVPLRVPPQPVVTQSMGSGSGAVTTWYPTDVDGNPVLVTFDHGMTISLWDQDESWNVNKSDFLGVGSFHESSDDSNNFTVTNGDSSNYTIYWTRKNWGV